jgi:hypothetical protein
MLHDVKDVAEKTALAIKLLVSAHDMQEIASQVTPPCMVGVDWLNAMVREWMREDLPINAVIVRSPAYPLVTTSGGQRIGFLDSGEIVAEAPDSAAFLQGESKVVLYPGTDTVQVRLKGTGDGPVSLSLVISQPGGGISLDYPDVQVNPSTVGMIDSSEGFGSLHLDQDGDGVMDVQVSAVEGEPAQVDGPRSTPAGFVDSLGKTIQENPRLAAAIGILTLSVVALSAALLMVLVRARAAGRMVLAGHGQEYLYGPVSQRARQPSPVITGRPRVASIASPGGMRTKERPPRHLAVLIDRSRPQRTYSLDGTMAIGRGRDNQIILDHPTVSRKHAWLDMQGDECWLFDIGSTNGTYVNNQPVRDTRRLQHGDVVRFGEAEFVFAEVS